MKNIDNAASSAEKNKVSFKWLTKRGSHHGMVSMGMTAIVIAIVILLNLAITNLPKNITQYDISGNALYEISDTTTKFVDSLQNNIDIIVICEDSKLDPRVETFIDKYAALSDKISVEYVDPVADPTVLDTYNCETGTVIVSCPDTGKTKSISLADSSDGAFIVYTLNSTTYSYDESYFDGDNVLTNGINYVVSGDSSKAYVLTGHGESDLSDGAASSVTNNNIEIAEDSLDLLVDGGVPDDCNLLICYSPTTDLANDELTIIQDYLQSGGNLLLLTDYCDLTNFNALMTEYGLAMQNGYVGDQTNYYSQYASTYGYYCLYPTLSTDSDITSTIESNALIVQPRGMLSVDPARDTITLTSFMTTSDKGLLYVDEDNYTIGQYILGATAVETIDSSIDEDGQSSVTVYSTTSLVQSGIEEYPSLSNLQIFSNSVGAIVGNTDSFAITAKSLDSSAYVTFDNYGFWAVLFVFIIPIAIFVGGIIYWNKRRKR